MHAVNLMNDQLSELKYTCINMSSWTVVNSINSEYVRLVLGMG